MKESCTARATSLALIGAVCLFLATALPLHADSGPGVPQSDSDGAAAAPETAATEEPASAADYVRRGHELLEKGAFEEAEQAFDNALGRNLRLHEAMTGKGAALARLGRHQEAEEMLKKALLLNPNPVRAHYELGLLYETTGDLDRAIAEYKKGIEKVKQGRK